MIGRPPLDGDADGVVGVVGDSEGAVLGETLALSLGDALWLGEALSLGEALWLGDEVGEDSGD